MDWLTIDWKALERLRAAFLDGTAGTRDYWQNERDFHSYDQTFGQRIRWKWDFVLNDLQRLAWTPPDSDTLDWGCGTGIATRAFLSHFGSDASRTCFFWDRSQAAMQYAAHQTREEFPSNKVWADKPPEHAIGTLLLSHVLTELSTEHVDALLPLVARATSVIWVEPGTYETSRRLIALREQLRSSFQVVAPCTHQAACGMLAPTNERHWCHQFAPSPPAVFMDGNWSRFAKLTGIDLRRLPLSYLVLDKRAAKSPTDIIRVVGLPRVYKPHALVLGCDSTGVREYPVTKRTQPDEFRQLKKGNVPTCYAKTTDETLARIKNA